MIELKPTTKTLICIGTGGVGKTTLAASMGLGFALEGKKVLVLTIDPSHRLAQALGLKPDGDLHQVDLDSVKTSFTKKNKGELWSCVINHQKAFENFIRYGAKGAAGEKEVEKLLKNKLYLQLSGRLSGSQEFTSLVTLYHHVKSEKFDLVILDTPPAQHTWNFLKAPEKISALFTEGIASWFRTDSESKSFIKKLINLGTAQVLKALEILTGSEFIQELSSFFKAIQNWQRPLENYVMQCHKLLTSKETEFVLVTGLDPSRLQEAEKLSNEIRNQGYKLTSIIINRVPQWLSKAEKIDSAAKQRLPQIIAYYQSLENELQKRIHSFTSRQAVYKCFEFSQNTEDVRYLKKNFDQIIRLS